MESKHTEGDMIKFREEALERALRLCVANGWAYQDVIEAADAFLRYVVDGPK